MRVKGLDGNWDCCCSSGACRGIHCFNGTTGDVAQEFESDAEPENIVSTTDDKVKEEAIGKGIEVEEVAEAEEDAEPAERTEQSADVASEKEVIVC